MLHLLREKASLNKLSIVLAVCSVLLCRPVHAQFNQRTDLNMADHDTKSYYFGITIGADLARFQITPHPRFLQYDSVLVAEPVNSGGLALGLSATTRLSNRFQLRFNPQLLFIERNIRYKLQYPDPIDNTTEVNKKIESVIMSFPIQLKFQSDRIGNFRVYTLAGFKTDLDMASNARKRRADELVKIDGFDYGPEFGIGFNFFFETFIFSPEIRISNGMRNIHSRDENLKFSNVIDKINSRMIVFTIHLEG